MDVAPFTIRRAQPVDAKQVALCVAAAYQPYIARIGKSPGPMLDDYAEIIAQYLVWVVEDKARIIGLVVLLPKTNSLLLDNVAVHPEFQGLGLGKQLLAFAETEARQRGFVEINLYTHQKMTKNINLYLKLGYVETERCNERGYDRVYMKKALQG